MKRKKKDVVDTLYKAVAAYLEDRGGKAVVIGGISILEWPGDKKFKFSVCVKVTGKRPIFKEHDHP